MREYTRLSATISPSLLAMITSVSRSITCALTCAMSGLALLAAAYASCSSLAFALPGTSMGISRIACTFVATPRTSETGRCAPFCAPMASAAARAAAQSPASEVSFVYT